MTPALSVLIPTLNEADNLPGVLISTRAALGADVEVIVADAGSTDGTALMAEAVGARVITCQRGRGLQLDSALHAAHGDICVLLHADTHLPPNARELIEAALRKAVAGAFSLRFDGGQLGWLAFAINLRSRLFRTATGDQAMFARRDVLLRVGGVPHVELFEDVRLWRQLKRAGRTTLLKAKVTTSARLWNQLGTWRGIFLHLRLRILHRLGMPPRRLAKMYPNSAS